MKMKIELISGTKLLILLFHQIQHLLPNDRQNGWYANRLYYLVISLFHHIQLDCMIVFKVCLSSNTGYSFQAEYKKQNAHTN